MNHARLVKALTKVGATIKNPNQFRPNYFVATNGVARLCWYTQAKWNDPTVMEAVSVHEPSDQTDIMTDCFCDYFPKTIKAAVAVVA